MKKALGVRALGMAGGAFLASLGATIEFERAGGSPPKTEMTIPFTQSGRWHS